MQMGVACKGCFEKDLEIKTLKEEIQKLKAQAKLQRQKVLVKGVYGLSTPSSKVPVKKNADAETQSKKGGGRLGHVGHGRKKVVAAQADRVVLEPLKTHSHCPGCQNKLQSKGPISRTIVDLKPIEVERVVYRLDRAYCSHCSKTYQAPVPGVASRALYSNRLLVEVLLLHYVHGISLGRIAKVFRGKVHEGALLNALHQLAERIGEAMPGIERDYLKEPVKHADETGWRTDGKSAYAWLFCSSQSSIYRFGQSRAAATPLGIFGNKKHSGVLVVDRFGAYNQVPCKIQYCFAHLLRQIEGLEEDFTGNSKIQSFVAEVAPLLSKSMKLRSEPISDQDYYLQAKQLEMEIRKRMSDPHPEPAVERIQQIFQKKEARLYHWVRDRRVPAENNQAEREIRTAVLARKVSFGSQSDRGAKTRSVWMSYLFTAQKRLNSKKIPLDRWLENVLEKLQNGPKVTAYSLLPPITIH